LVWRLHPARRRPQAPVANRCFIYAASTAVLALPAWSGTPCFYLLTHAGLRLQQRWAGWNREAFDASSGTHVSVYERSLTGGLPR
jgi:hypothetical protein